MNTIKLNSINRLANGRIEYLYDAPKHFYKFVKDRNQNLFIDLPEDVDIQSIPDGILAIPFIGAILSVSMIMDYRIEVPEIDKTFYEAIPLIANTYKEQYPYVRFYFNVTSSKVVDCANTVTENSKSVFFTGGLDASSAFIGIYDSKPTLINVWGGDIEIADMKSHVALEDYLKKLTCKVGNDYVFIRSNCHEYYIENKVTKLYGLRIFPWHYNGWWASIASIFSMGTTIAPYLYAKGIQTHYVGSSYDANNAERSANNANFMNAFRFGNCKFSMSDNYLGRSEKAKKVVEFDKLTGVKLQLKVCWYRSNSNNCSHCEKCYRTIMDLLSQGGDPNNYGFNINDDGYAEMHRFLSKAYVHSTYWEAIKKNFLKNRAYWENNKDVSWILDMKFNKPSAIFNKYYKQITKVFRF